MSDPDELLSEADQRWGPIVDASQIGRVVAQIQAAQKKAQWESNVQLVLGTKHWRPAAVTESENAILHVCLTGAIPKFVASRIEEAFALGYHIHVALTLDALYASEVLEVLAAVDASAFVLEKPFSRNLRPRHFMAAMADLDVPTDPATRVRISKAVHGKIKSGTKQEKGRRLEALLAFLFSQVADFRVVERNLRTATQEIDIVLQIHNYSERAWQQQVPYLLVEAKNRTDPTSQDVVSTLITKVRTKGQSCKTALLISTSGFTSDAKNEELRYSESENRIIMIGPIELTSLIEATDLDETLDQIVRRGRMR